MLERNLRTVPRVRRPRRRSARLLYYNLNGDASLPSESYAGSRRRRSRRTSSKRSRTSSKTRSSNSRKRCRSGLPRTRSWASESPRWRLRSRLGSRSMTRRTPGRRRWRRSWRSRLYLRRTSRKLLRLVKRRSGRWPKQRSELRSKSRRSNGCRHSSRSRRRRLSNINSRSIRRRRRDSRMRRLSLRSDPSCRQCESRSAGTTRCKLLRRTNGNRHRLRWAMVVFGHSTMRILTVRRRLRVAA